MSDEEKSQKYQRLHDVLFTFFTSAFKENFNKEIWLISASSRESIEENCSADNFNDYLFLGKEVDVLHIDTWLQKLDDSQWCARLNLDFTIDLAGLSVNFTARVSGNELDSLDMDDNDYNTISLEKMDAFRKAVVTHYGVLRPFT